MTGGRLSTNMKLAMSTTVIAAVLVASGTTAFSVRESGERLADDLVDNKTTEMLLISLKAEIVESMIPAHDYLIDPGKDQISRFRSRTRRVKNSFEKLFEWEKKAGRDGALLRQSREQFLKMEAIQEELFELPEDKARTDGPKKMDEMHVYQDSVLDYFDRFALAEEAKLEKRVTAQNETNRRSLIALAVAAVTALGTAVFVGSLSSKLWE